MYCPLQFHECRQFFIRSHNKTFLSPRCASIIQIVRPPEPTVDTQTQVQPMVAKSSAMICQCFIWCGVEIAGHRKKSPVDKSSLRISEPVKRATITQKCVLILHGGRSVGSASRRACLGVSLRAPSDPLPARVTRDTRRGGFFSAIALFFSTCSHGKGREHDARRLKTSAIVIRLRDSDLAGLHVLGFRQSQRHETLIDFRADFVGID